MGKSAPRGEKGWAAAPCRPKPVLQWTGPVWAGVTVRETSSRDMGSHTLPKPPESETVAV